MATKILRMAVILMLLLVGIVAQDAFCQNQVITRPQRTQQTTRQTTPTAQQRYNKDLKKGEQLFDAEQYADAKKHFVKMLAKYPKYETEINRWITACDTMLSEESETEAVAANETSALTTGYINGHEWVDLGLPSGLKWATCNVGASTPSDYGNYYAWGETSTKSEYTKGNSKTDNKNIGDISGNSSYDAARANWGGSWRMPTQAEFEELINNCKWEWTTQGGHNGYKVTSKKNGNSIFLPASGYRYGASLYGARDFSYYWSSAPKESNPLHAYSLIFNSGDLSTRWGGRLYGQSVRAVSD